MTTQSKAVIPVPATDIERRQLANQLHAAAQTPVTTKQLLDAHRLLTSQRSSHARRLKKILTDAGIFKVAS